MKEVACIIGSSGNITLVFPNGKTKNVSPDHRNYDKILECLKSKQYDRIEELIELVEVSRQIENFAEGSKIRIDNGCIYYGDEEISNVLTERIFQFIEHGQPSQPLINFLENLMENPSYSAIQELYLFMESNMLPVTEDGYLLAYKGVDAEYMDSWTHKTHRNKIGDKPSMPRHLVDDNRKNTCSFGLHFCSLKYLAPNGRTSYPHVMIIKIHPKDVVCIPDDYGNQKGRCCAYEVIAEHECEHEIKEAFDRPVYSANGSEFNHCCPECGCEDYDGKICDSENGCGYDPDYDECPECGSNCYNGSVCDSCNYGWDEEENDPQSSEDTYDEPEEKTIVAENNSKIIPENGDLGRKPDGNGFWNVRDMFGRFTKKKV